MINYRDKRERWRKWERDRQTGQDQQAAKPSQKASTIPLFKTAGELGMVALVSNPRLNSYSDSGQPGLQCKTLHKKGGGGKQEKCLSFCIFSTELNMNWTSQ